MSNEQIKIERTDFIYQDTAFDIQFELRGEVFTYRAYAIFHRNSEKPNLREYSAIRKPSFKLTTSERNKIRKLMEEKLIELVKAPY